MDVREYRTCEGGHKKLHFPPRKYIDTSYKNQPISAV